MCSGRLLPPGAQSCGSAVARSACSVALFLFPAHRAGPEVVDMAFASPCVGLPTVVTPFTRCRVRCSQLGPLLGLFSRLPVLLPFSG